ncbi:MAG TPA: FecR family protein [Thermoanaerobaculia bacterium]
MRKVLTYLLFTVLLALPSLAVERHQSYISYDDGGTIVHSGEDGREIDAHRNLPIYPGDEVVTARRGRAEVRLSDGNIIGLDRSTSLRFDSILDSYEGESDETVVQLRNGKIAVQRTDLGRDRVRVDTENASYVAEYEGIYSVETDDRGRDRVVVFEGSLEIRTRQRATRLRRGESATIDDDGVYDLTGDQTDAADDFERWFLRRAERFDNYNNRYVDRKLGYWGDDLDDHGKWIFVTGIGWSWRPTVAASWRPYYNGYWYRGRAGCLTWVSYDPWGWAPFHYGRWSYDPMYGWFWVPGYGYSPAWVYWWYGSGGYVGWAPSGWWDCHRGYYDWAYRPYRNADFGFGFNGRIRVSDMDLRPWTFVDSTGLISTRVDRAALSADAIKQRLGRSGGGFDSISGSPARFTREEVRDPAAAIRRHGLGNDTSAATAPDMTAYFRRDPNLNGGVRDRIVRSRGTAPSAPNTPSSGTTASTPDYRGNVGGGRINRGGSGGGNTGGGSVAPIAGGSPAPIRGGSVSPINGGSPAPVTGGGDSRRGEGGSITRGTTPPATSEPDNGGRTGRTINRDRDNDGNDNSRGSGNWRDRVQKPADTPQVTPPPVNSAPPPSDDSTNRRAPRDDSWRNKARGGDAPKAETPSSDSSSSSGSSVSRRIIDRIGGARIYPRGDSTDSASSSGGSSRRGSGSGSSTRSGDSGRSSGGSREAVRPSRPSSDSGSSTRSSGSSSSGSSSSGRSSGGDGGSRSSGSNRGEGGNIKKD